MYRSRTEYLTSASVVTRSRLVTRCSPKHVIVPCSLNWQRYIDSDNNKLGTGDYLLGVSLPRITHRVLHKRLPLLGNVVTSELLAWHCLISMQCDAFRSKNSFKEALEDAIRTTTCATARWTRSGAVYVVLASRLVPSRRSKSLGRAQLSKKDKFNKHVKSWIRSWVWIRKSKKIAVVVAQCPSTAPNNTLVFDSNCWHFLKTEKLE